MGDMGMIQIAIVEDDDRYAERLFAYMDRFMLEENMEISLTRFTDGDEIAENYTGGFDIILMDIEMRFMNGMEAAQRIRQADELVEIIFVTNMAQYAIQGYKVRALDYIVKPVEYMSFCESLKRGIRNADKSRDKYLTINFKEGIRKINIADIIWIESQGHRLTFNTKEKSYETTTYSMKELAAQLKEYGFSRCNNGILVNLRFATGMAGGQVIVDGNELPVSRGRRNEFMDDMVSYLNQ
jgi:DNA-binding LytR/AlgR family response regulator